MRVNGGHLTAYSDGVLGHVNGGHLTAYADGSLGHVNGRPLRAYRDGSLGYVAGARGFPQPMFGEGRAFADGLFSHGGTHAQYESELKAFADGVLGHVNGHPLRAYQDGSLGAAVNGKYNQVAYRGGIMATPFNMMAGRDGMLGQEAVIGVSDAEKKAAVSGYIAGMLMGGLAGLLIGGVIGYAAGKK